MKKVILSLSLVLAAMAGFSQTDHDLAQLKSARDFLATTDLVYPYIDSGPGYVGGNEKWSKYIESAPVFKNAVEAAKNKGIAEGSYTILVRFAINPDGSVGDVKAVSKPLGYGLEEAAVKLIQQSGKWVPANVEGKDVRSYVNFPVKFSIVRS
jgi:TonB family protein